MSELEYVLARVLVEHQRLGLGACFCCWAQLGGSHVAHVAQVQALTVRATMPGAMPDRSRG